MHFCYLRVIDFEARILYLIQYNINKVTFIGFGTVNDFVGRLIVVIINSHKENIYLPITSIEHLQLKTIVYVNNIDIYIIYNYIYFN